MIWQEKFEEKPYGKDQFTGQGLFVPTIIYHLVEMVKVWTRRRSQSKFMLTAGLGVRTDGSDEEKMDRVR